MLKINKLAAFDAFTRYLLSDADPSFSSLVLAGGDPVSHHSFTQVSSGAGAIKASVESTGESCETIGQSLGLGTRKAETPQPRGSLAGLHFVKKFSSSSGLKSRNSQNSLNFFSNSGVSWRSLLFGRIATYWAELMRRTLAPLRKIVARELEVFELRRNSVHPQSFAVHDRLECGHVHTSLLWDIFDLLNGYSESAHVRAVRHRCSECLTLTQRKPMQSVTAVSKAA